MKIKNILLFVFSLIVCQGAGAIGSIFTAPSVAGWYATLEKPVFTPPSWVFAPVWILLYLLMAVSLYLVLKEGSKDKQAKLGLFFFFIQLALNVYWSFLFFGLHQPVLAFLGILVLWLSIAVTILQFWKISKTAAYLMLPYLFWVSFAACLNFSIILFN